MTVTPRQPILHIFNICKSCEYRNGKECSKGGNVIYYRKTKRFSCPLGYSNKGMSQEEQDQIFEDFLRDILKKDG